MSATLIDLAWKQDVKTTAKTILVYMAWKADETGCCWPSVDDLRLAARVTPAAVYTALNTLEAAGLITRENRPRHTNLYRLHLEGGAEA